MSRYVLVRIIRMDNVDIGLFEHDRNNTLYFYLLNSDEQIYTRYGGRDSVAPDTYLNLESLEMALKQGLDLHEKYQRGELAKVARPKPAFPKELPLLVERTFARNQCVECHLIGDFQNLHREKDKTLDKMTHLYRSPFPRSSNVIHLRPARVAGADRNAVAVVTMTRPRGYFGLGRDAMSLDGKPLAGIVAGVAGGSTAKVSLHSDSGRAVIAEFNGTRIAARAWPVAGNHVTLIELH